jgi:lysophospholipid acyltransferase (LPLAT)-like uncharacterized protein
MSSLKRITASPAFVTAAGSFGAWYLRFVWQTNRIVFEPHDLYDTVKIPAIIAVWHGQHFLMPFLKKPGDPTHRAKVLISRHRDGELNARAAEKLGIGTIRGSGAHNGEFYRKGGTAAMSQMIDALNEGYNVAMTADVPKVARVAGMGVVKLGQYSQRPIYAAAIASSRRKVLDNWDRTAINLPFGTVAVVGSDPMYVPADADAATLEAVRQKVQDELNEMTRRAYAIVDKKSATP